MLIEVMFGALLLGIATTAVLSGLDGAQETGRKNKNRSVAATLAQQDIERLRAFTVAALSDYDETRTVPVSGVSYTVHSKAEWVRDATGIVSCTDNTKQAQYLKISSEVTSPASVNQAVKESTLLAPGAGTGAAVVKLTNRDGQPVKLAAVGLTGPVNVSGSTNDEGCAIFGSIAPGSYTIATPDLVTWASSRPGTGSVSVNVANTSVAQMEVDVPASLRAHFKTTAGASNGPDAQWNVITVAHANLPGQLKVFPENPGANAFSVDAGELFPQKTGYGVYAGNCTANNPDSWNGSANYFQPGGHGFVQLNPGDVLRDVNVYMPTLHVTVNRGTTDFTTSKVVLTQTDSGCTTSVAPISKPSGTLKTWTAHFAVPFGHYSICADTVTSSGSRRRVTTTTGGNLTSEVDNSTTVNTSSGTSSTC